MKKLFLIILLFIITNNSWGQTFKEAGFSLPNDVGMFKSQENSYHAVKLGFCAINMRVKNISDRRDEYMSFLKKIKQENKTSHFEVIFYKGLRTYKCISYDKALESFIYTYFFCTDQRSYQISFCYSDFSTVENFVKYCLNNFKLI